MSKTNEIKTKVSSFGKKVTMTMAPQKLEEILKHIPEDHPDRKTLEEAVSTSKETKRIDNLRARLTIPFSHETLNRYGWTMCDEEGYITSGVRYGDFRFDKTEDQEGWSFGPAGAFDRETPETRVIRNGWQAGVFCEKYSIWFMPEPVTNEKEAWEQARTLMSDWEKSVPKKLRNLMEYDETHPDLPKEAMRWHGNSLRFHGRLSDKVRVGDYEDSDAPLYTKGETGRIDVIQFDAILGSSLARYDILADLCWTFGQRPFSPRWDSTHYPLHGPLYCVLGNVWGTTTRFGYASNEMHPYYEKADAEKAALYKAIQNNIVEVSEVELPNTIKTPEYGKVEVDTDNPFA